MENQKSTQQCYRNNCNFSKVKLALKNPRQNFSKSMLHNVAKIMMVDLQIISKLPGINGDRFDWYLVEASGTLDDLFLTIVTWRELGVEEYMVVSA